MKWAVLHLKAIDDCIRKLGDFSNLNLHDSMTALASERKKLVTDNAAYADADEILKAMACGTYHPADEAPE